MIALIIISIIFLIPQMHIFSFPLQLCQRMCVCVHVQVCAVCTWKRGAMDNFCDKLDKATWTIIAPFWKYYYSIALPLEATIPPAAVILMQSFNASFSLQCKPTGFFSL